MESRLGITRTAKASTGLRFWPPGTIRTRVFSAFILTCKHIAPRITGIHGRSPTSCRLLQHGPLNHCRPPPYHHHTTTCLLHLVADQNSFAQRRTGGTQNRSIRQSADADNRLGASYTADNSLYMLRHPPLGSHPTNRT